MRNHTIRELVFKVQKQALYSSMRITTYILTTRTTITDQIMVNAPYRKVSCTSQLNQCKKCDRL